MTNLYDRVRYPSQIFGHTNPAALGALARLLGRPIAPMERSRVLEIGCGEGVNLINMALAAPHAEFLGLDLAPATIATARATAASCGSANVSFHARNLADADAKLGAFDVIVAHGVYAWTSAAVRTALLRVVGERLAPDGVAVISYATLPASRFNQAIRDMLLVATDGVDDPRAKLDAARAYLAEAIAAWSDAEADEAALKSLARRILQRAPEVLLHDELGPDYAPQLLVEVVAHAAKSGLTYLCDADPTLSAEAFFPSEDFKAIRARAAGDWVRFEQLADFRAVRTFRYSVFGRGGGADRRIDATRLIGLWAFADLTIAEADPHRPDGAAFVSTRGGKLRTDNPRFAAFLVRLAEAYPLGVRLDSEDEAHALCEPVIRLFLAHVVELRTAQPPCVRISGDRPEASALARIQAGRGETQLATLRHAMIRIDEPSMLAFVPLMDGSRTRAELVQEFGRLFAVAQDEAEWRLDESLAELGRRGLMTG
jgi:SAM-dependent methyltransferase